MASVVRIFALSGVILLGIGAFIPVSIAPDRTCRPGAGALLDTHCFDDTPRASFLATELGILVVALAVVGLVPALRRRPAALWVFGLMVAGLVVVLWLFVDALRNKFLVRDIDWGWGVLFSSALLILLAALLATVSQARRTS